MAVKKVTLSAVAKKDLILVGYLLASGGLGWVLANYVANDPMLTAIFAPVINYVLYRITKELENQGYRAALK